MNTQFWSRFPLIFAASQTLAVVIMIELILWKIPYLSLFLVIFSIVLYFNLKAAGLFSVRRDSAITMASHLN